MDEIEKRLRDSADACVTSYEAWRKDEKNSKSREELLEAVHELRKVSSRLEIEIAISERQDMAEKPIPIPPHRSSKRGKGEQTDILDGGDNSFNSDMDGGDRATQSQRSGGGCRGGQRRNNQRRSSGN